MAGSHIWKVLSMTGLPPFLTSPVRAKISSEEALALTILKEYAAVGAVKELENSAEFLHSGHIVPSFVVSKTELTEIQHRLIMDCRILNQFIIPRPF